MTETTITAHRPYDDDKHRWLFVMSSRVMGTDDNNHRYEVRLCRDCGKFECYGDKNGQRFDFSFELPTDELVEAAGQYAKLLEQDINPLSDG